MQKRIICMKNLGRHIHAYHKLLKNANKLRHTGAPGIQGDRSMNFCTLDQNDSQ